MAKKSLRPVDATTTTTTTTGVVGEGDIFVALKASRNVCKLKYAVGCTRSCYLWLAVQNFELKLISISIADKIQTVLPIEKVPHLLNY